MNDPVEIAGLNLLVKQVSKINDPAKAVLVAEAVKVPLVNLSEVEDNHGNKSFDMQMVAYIPNILTPPDPPPSAFPIPIPTNGENPDIHSIFFKYNGVFRIKTLINTLAGDHTVLCRDFEIVYDASENPTGYDAYMFTINYKLLFKDMLTAEAVIVRDVNLDPETSRGTVTTPTYV